MIVRILGEGQFEVADSQLDGLNALDAAVESAVEADDNEAFGTALDRTPRRRTQQRHAARRTDSLEDSDLILPPADATIAEVRELLSDDGLIPG